MEAGRRGAYPTYWPRPALTVGAAPGKVDARTVTGQGAYGARKGRSGHARDAGGETP
jgi:hypothetical protein